MVGILHNVGGVQEAFFWTNSLIACVHKFSVQGVNYSILLLLYFLQLLAHLARGLKFAHNLIIDLLISLLEPISHFILGFMHARSDRWGYPE